MAKLCRYLAIQRCGYHLTCMTECLLELTLPAKVRREMMEGTEKYPFEALRGYHSSGSTKTALGI